MNNTNDDQQSVEDDQQQPIGSFYETILPYEKQLLCELRQHPNSLIVLARGLSITKAVASIIYQFRNKTKENSPFIVFLVHFTDSEFNAIEYYLKNHDDKMPLNFVKITSHDSLSQKRIEQYMKGGVFSVSYKSIVLDLLTKKLSPGVITGFIVNHVQRIQEQSSESFLNKILREDNKKAFINCFTDRPSSFFRGGLDKVKRHMSRLQGDNILAYPRIRRSVQLSLDNDISIRVYEQQCPTSKNVKKMQLILFELIQTVIDELKSQVSSDPRITQVLTIEVALQPSFLGEIQHAMGREFLEIGIKAKSLIKNILELKKLIFVLLNFDCVTFYNYLCCLVFNEYSENLFKNEIINKLDKKMKFNFELGCMNSYSLFKYCDSKTLELINILQELAKERIFSVVPISNSMDIFSENNDFTNDSFNKKDKKDKKKNIDSKTPSFINLTMRKEYGKLMQRYNTFWSIFKDKALKYNKDNDELRDIDREYDLQIHFEGNPKFEAIVRILQRSENQFKGQGEYKKYEQISIKRLHLNPKKKQTLKYKDNYYDEAHGQEAQNQLKAKQRLRETANQNILIALKTKSQKLKQDLLKFLIHSFVKSDNAKGFFEDKFRSFLCSKFEITRRENAVTTPNGKPQYIIEAHLLQKLSLLLEQRRDYLAQKIMAKTGVNPKKRPRSEMSDSTKEYYQRIDVNDIANDLATEDVIQEVEEDDYKIFNIIDGFNVYVEAFTNNSDFEISLRNINPSTVIIYEPTLEFMRAIESFNAERRLMRQECEEIVVHILMNEDSGEIKQYCYQIEQEKLSFKALMQLQEEIKKKQGLDMLNQEIERMMARSMVKQKMDYELELKSYQDKDIIAVDCREFSCLTPIYLFEKGFWLVPISLYVGDYILSDEICIERKSFNTGDLFESFKNGRLLSQITNMHRFYKIPVLLIEFDDSVPFKIWDGYSEIVAGGDVNPSSIMSKLSLLTLHFPNLQILWSKNPFHTAEIFKQLKNTQKGLLKDPDLHKISRIGRVNIEQDNNENLSKDIDQDDEFNRFMPQEFLKKLPGITSNNIAEIGKRVKNLVELCNLSEDELKKIIGPKYAKELRGFLQNKPEKDTYDYI